VQHPLRPCKGARVDTSIVRSKILLSWSGRLEGDDTLKVVRKSLFRSLLQQFGLHETQKPLEFPHAEGTLVPTPFGQGSVVRPVPVTGKGRRETATRVPPTNGIALDSWTLWNEPYTFLHG